MSRKASLIQSTLSTNSDVSENISRGLNRQDISHLEVLDPEWLLQFDSEKQKDAFFWSILPILAARVGDEQPSWSYVTPTRLQLSADITHGISGPDFNLDEAMKEYKDNPIQLLNNLTNLIILERARTMYEKIWMRCSEFCLVGLAYFAMKQDRHVEAGHQEQVGAVNSVEASRASVRNPHVNANANKFFIEPEEDIRLEFPTK